jgi:predicted esterase
VPQHRLTTGRRARYVTIGGPADGLSPSIDGVSDTAADDVWIVLHGFGQLAEPFARQFERVASSQRLIVAPEALNRFYLEVGPSGTHADAPVGATWMTREDREAEIADYVDWIDAVFSETVPAAARVTAFGFSQGVATVMRWLTLGRAGRADRVVLWTGQLPHDLDLARFAERVRGAHIVLVYGTTDRYASLINDGDAQPRLAALGLDVRSLSFDGGHRLDNATLDRLAAGSA